MVLGLDLVLGSELHVVAQVIEAELVVGSVCDIAAVCLTAALIVHVGDNYTDCEAQEAVNRAHPGCVTLCQVVVDGYDVDSVAFKGVEIACGDAGERFSFTGFQLKDLSLVQDYGSHYLDIVVAFTQDPAACLAHQCIGLRQ